MCDLWDSAPKAIELMEFQKVERKPERLNIYISERDKERLERLARLNNLSVSEVARQLLANSLKEISDSLDIKEPDPIPPAEKAVRRLVKHAIH